MGFSPTCHEECLAKNMSLAKKMSGKPMGGKFGEKPMGEKREGGKFGEKQGEKPMGGKFDGKPMGGKPMGGKFGEKQGEKREGGKFGEKQGEKREGGKRMGEFGKPMLAFAAPEAAAARLETPEALEQLQARVCELLSAANKTKNPPAPVRARGEAGRGDAGERPRDRHRARGEQDARLGPRLRGVHGIHLAAHHRDHRRRRRWGPDGGAHRAADGLNGQRSCRAVRRRISVEGSAHTPEQIGGSGGAERTLSISEFGRHCGAYRASALAPEELFRRLGEASASRDCCACPDRAAATPVTCVPRVHDPLGVLSTEHFGGCQAVRGKVT